MESALGAPEEDKARTRLREAFLSFREKARLLTAEIHRDLPDFTVHDITHLDALWEMAALVAGPEIRLTPPEAFVLGGAILLHDAGMALAAYPGGLAELQGTQRWQDTVAALLRTRLERHPLPEELLRPPEDVTAEALRELLRASHAEQASRLPSIEWKSRSGTRYHLIEDVGLRKTFGELIGRIAQSHHWPVSRLADEFSEVAGAPAWCPGSWLVDPLKLACLLRIADASHLDERRAPGFLRALRKPSGHSDPHWAFQERLLKPRREAERLVYTSSRFPLEEAPAWWLCFDALRMVDRELHAVDSLLADLERPRLAVHGVAGVEDPLRLVRLIPTEGWLPVDTRVKVSDIPLLLKRLGGEQLYGENPGVPLRELLQNAADAVRARRVLEGRPANWGDVIVREGQDEQGLWLEVEDTGLGMSQEVLIGPLLDFGTSYWTSPLARAECPGLMSKGFRPTGKYGIGFFSVFMWGDRVRVVTRRVEEAQRDTRVLEFHAGLGSRPLLRPAREEERLREGGTRVRVWFDAPLKVPEWLRSVVNEEKLEKLSFGDALAMLYPCPDVNVHIEDATGRLERVLAASDWIDMEGTALLERLRLQSALTDPLWFKNEHEDVRQARGRNLRLLHGPAGEVLGRATISFMWKYGPGFSRGIIVNGGLRIDELESLSGVLVGSPQSAARASALPRVDPKELARWATEQGQLWQREPLPTESLNEVAQVVRSCGGEVTGLPVAFADTGWLTLEDIARRQWGPEVILVHRHEVGLEFADGEFARHYSLVMDRQYSQLHANILAVDQVGSSLLRANWLGTQPSWPWTNEDRLHGIIPKGTLAWSAVEALARAWGVETEQVVVAHKADAGPDLIIGQGSEERGTLKAFDWLIVRKPA
ncbi:ATP-binding protein [Archangium gephyra]|uniref:HD domain-containing protein n=1 Tax=Archangium gephyra TaxID=48 RepID=UPI0035D4213E